MKEQRLKDFSLKPSPYAISSVLGSIDYFDMSIWTASSIGGDCLITFACGFAYVWYLDGMKPIMKIETGRVYKGDAILVDTIESVALVFYNGNSIVFIGDIRDAESRVYVDENQISGMFKLDNNCIVAMSDRMVYSFNFASKVLKKISIKPKKQFFCNTISILNCFSHIVVNSSILACNGSTLVQFSTSFGFVKSLHLFSRRIIRIVSNGHYHFVLHMGVNCVSLSRIVFENGSFIVKPFAYFEPEFEFADVIIVSQDLIALVLPEKVEIINSNIYVTSKYDRKPGSPIIGAFSLNGDLIIHNNRDGLVSLTTNDLPHNFMQIMKGDIANIEIGAVEWNLLSSSMCLDVEEMIKLHKIISQKYPSRPDLNTNLLLLNIIKRCSQDDQLFHHANTRTLNEMFSYFSKCVDDVILKVSKIILEAIREFEKGTLFSSNELLSSFIEFAIQSQLMYNSPSPHIVLSLIEAGFRLTGDTQICKLRLQSVSRHFNPKEFSNSYPDLTI